MSSLGICQLIQDVDGMCCVVWTQLCFLATWRRRHSVATISSWLTAAEFETLTTLIVSAGVNTSCIAASSGHAVYCCVAC